ncbi:MAG: hypothetical protein JO000_02325 [Alphaproteobacteria bacterium]|nr:hypothetical protein [Alphaproteobacteria bacterium]
MAVLSENDRPKRWRMRAEEMLRLAENMSNNETRAVLLKLAADYERRAERGEHFQH